MFDRVLPALTLIAVGAATHFAFASQVAATPRVLVYLLATYGALAALALWRMWDEGTLIDLFRWRSGDVALGVALGLGLVGAVFVGRSMVAPSGSPGENWVVRLYLQLGPVPTGAREGALYSLGIVAVAALEEVVWRGMVQQILEQRFGVRTGWLAATGLYGLAHLPSTWQLAIGPGGRNPLLVVAALFCGVVWGFFVARKQRLPPSMIAHVVFTYVLAVQMRLWST